MISIQNLHFSYRKKPVFNDLTLQFTPGHVYGLLGKNGTGKSTLLRSIAGLLNPQKGSVSINGVPSVQRLPQTLQNIYLVPEEFYLPDIPIARFVKVQAPFYAKFDAGRFKNYCTAFEIPEDSTLQNMSYGQKKKVLISFALATNADVLLMDEPTNGLDIMSKSQFRKVLAESYDENRCLIVSTHQVKDLENLIDRVTIIDDGSILFDQDIEAVSKKLSFRLSFDNSESREALYSESSLRGNVIIAPNTSGEESKIDMELLYKAIVTNGEKIKAVFKS